MFVCLFVLRNDVVEQQRHAMHEYTSKTMAKPKTQNQKLDIQSEIMQTMCRLVKLAVVILTLKVLKNHLTKQLSPHVLAQFLHVFSSRIACFVH